MQSFETFDYMQLGPRLPANRSMSKTVTRQCYIRYRNVAANIHALSIMTKFYDLLRHSLPNVFTMLHDPTRSCYVTYAVPKWPVGAI